MARYNNYGINRFIDRFQRQSRKAISEVPAEHYTSGPPVDIAGTTYISTLNWTGFLLPPRDVLLFRYGVLHAYNVSGGALTNPKMDGVLLKQSKRSDLGAGTSWERVALPVNRPTTSSLSAAGSRAFVFDFGKDLKIDTRKGPYLFAVLPNSASLTLKVTTNETHSFSRAMYLTTADGGVNYTAASGGPSREAAFDLYSTRIFNALVEPTNYAS